MLNFLVKRLINLFHDVGLQIRGHKEYLFILFFNSFLFFYGTDARQPKFENMMDGYFIMVWGYTLLITFTGVEISYFLKLVSDLFI